MSVMNDPFVVEYLRQVEQMREVFRLVSGRDPVGSELLDMKQRACLSTCLTWLVLDEKKEGERERNYN